MKYIPRYCPNHQGKLHPEIPLKTDNGSYIYFLLKSGNIVYIGQSISIRIRIYQHNAYKDYDTIRLIKCPFDKLLYYEQRWIMKFQPSGNQAHHPINRGGPQRRKKTYNALIQQKFLSNPVNREKLNRKNRSRYNRKKNIKQEKLKAMVRAGFSVDVASERLGMNLKSVNA